MSEYASNLHSHSSSPSSESRPLLSQDEVPHNIQNENIPSSSPSSFPRARAVHTLSVTPPQGEMHSGVEALGEEEIIKYASPSKEAVFIRSLPVVFVIILLSALYFIYTLYHCIPLLQIEVPRDQRDHAAFDRGLGELIAFNILTILLLISYGLAIFTHPGEIPNDNEWNAEEEEEDILINHSGSDELTRIQTETKRKGGKRRCKWCIKLKPDRAHHCRVCRRCILKMDHHCPWIYNCVGWKNHKYFMLSLLYGSLTTTFLSITMFESVKKALDQPAVSFDQIFLLLFGETLNMFLGLIVVVFFCFHIWLLFNGMTTIEFCEKQVIWSQKKGTASLWDRGCVNNFTDVFGSNPFLWFLPLDNRSGDGIHFISENTRLLEDVENNGATGRFLSRNLEKSIKDGKQFEPIIDDDSSSPPSRIAYD